MRTVTEESLRRRLARLESALESEKARLRKVCGGIPWGAGMRRTKCTPLIPKGGRTDWENQGGETATLPNVRRR